MRQQNEPEGYITNQSFAYLCPDSEETSSVLPDELLKKNQQFGWLTTITIYENHWRGYIRMSKLAVLIWRMEIKFIL